MKIGAINIVGHQNNGTTIP